MNAEVLRNNQGRTHIVYKTDSKLHAVVLDNSVHLAHLPLRERSRLVPLEYKGKPYPIRRAVSKLKRAGRVLGITEGAAKVLKEMT